jgi:hypothetical protein
MSFSLYVLFDPTGEGRASVIEVLRNADVTGYTFFDAPLKAAINPPDEPNSTVRCTYYAENYFRLFISDLAVQFYREASLPDWIAKADEQIVHALLAARQIRLRRWINTQEGWDDDDLPFVRIVGEGDKPEELPDALGVLNTSWAG